MSQSLRNLSQKHPVSLEELVHNIAPLASVGLLFKVV